jgi:hypothetical protein
MRPLAPVAAYAAALILAVSICRPASAQNDWQFPDPYFGAIEIQKSHAAPPAAKSWRSEPSTSVRKVPLTPARPRLIRGRARWTGRGTPP